jgi:hypothetical protein
MNERIAAELAKAKSGVRSVVLVLSSCGGSLGEAERVIETLKDVKKTRFLETRVDQGDTCGSACIPVFLQGTRRRARRALGCPRGEPRAKRARQGVSTAR